MDDYSNLQGRPTPDLFGGKRSALYTSLISAWKLNDAANGNRADSAGANTLTDGLTNVGSVAGLIGNAADFHTAYAVGKRLTIASNATLAIAVGESFTCSTWVKLSSLTANEGIVSKFAAASEYLLWIDVTPNLTLQVHNAANAQVSLVITATPTLAAWHNIVFGYDNTAQQVFAYYDNGARQNAACVGILAGAGQFSIGNYGNGFAIDGLMDETSFWKRVLTAGEVNTIWNGGAGKGYPY